MALKPGQQKCINTLDRSLVVAAGAGSGKTFTLTKRVVHALECGAVDGIDRVCAITFTNKAAGELKSRIKAELRACGLAEEALKVDEAWISTIHGMCARILKAHAIELDLDPKFQMADAVLVGQLLDRSIDAVLAKARAGVAMGGVQDSLERDPRWLEAVDALFDEYPARSYGPRSNSVESMLRTIMDAASSNVDGFDAFVYKGATVNPAVLVDTVLDTYEALVDMARAQKPSEAREAWAASVEELAPTIRAEMQEGNAADALWALRMLDKLPLPKRVGTADYKEQVGEAIQVYRMCIMELRLAAAAPHMDTLLQLARIAADTFSAAKRAAGVLDNNDLLVLASDAIASHPEIAALYTDKFQLIMVDEFQDTDQMQVDMIKKLAGPGACRLCTVGDAQQSIYRFRGADVSVYRRHLEEVRSGNPDDVILLPDNFRSHRDVLSLVDRVFEQPHMFGGEFMSLAPGRDEGRVKRPFAQGVERVQVQLTSNAYRGASSAQVRETAAARIADAFADLRERGHSAGDMAILLGGMTYADVYANALRERGLACVIAGGSVFASTPEAKMVRELSAIAANPYQTEPLHNVLTGPLFMLSPDDLLQMATTVDEGDGAPRRRNLYSGFRACLRVMRESGPLPPWSPQMQLALRVLGSYLDGAGKSQISRIVMRVIVESGWVVRMQDQGAEGLARVANAYKAIRMIEDIESSSASGPARTARMFQALLGESKEAPGALSATGGDFVRIMTVHASKGLEFPIVAVAEFRDSGASSSGLLESEIGGKVYLSLDLQNSITALSGAAKLKDLPMLYADMTEGQVDEAELAQAIERADGALALRSALHQYESVGDEEEAKRLLYVALTRAKEALVVSMRGKRTKDNPQATPKSCFGAVVSALAGDHGFDVGVSHFDYQGTAAALVDHWALEADGGTSDALAAVEDASGDSGLGEGHPFAVPAPRAVPAVTRVPYAPAHDGIFSYSSISDASHEGTVLEELAALAFVSSDEAAAEFGMALQDDGALSGERGFGLRAGRSNRAAAVVDEDDGSWAYVGTSSADSDKATDLGTAFHRLAQYAVVTRESGVLSIPPADRIASLARAGHLDDAQRARLQRALDRWFGCDLAGEMAAYDDLRAEAPFFLEVPRGESAGSAYLEGEIDLIGIDGARAVVVDYKTGGRPDETADTLRVKHVLQAACYAYAVMLQGVREVDAVFVRVEQPRADDPDQPQCVRYHFDESNVPVLARAIAEVYGRMRQD